MAFTTSGSTILISGNETLASFATWANSNSQATRHDDNTVEANNQLKIQNGAVFDTSLGTLIINQRVEGQNNNTSDSGIWRSHGGCIIQQGGSSNFAEWWAIMDFDRAHFISNKSGGKQAFFRSNGSATPINIANSTFIHNSGEIDGHLQFSGGTGVVANTYFESKAGNTAFLLVRDSDSDGVSLIGIDLGGWNSLTQPTTFHKNMVFEHGSGGNQFNIVFYYRRNNYPIFYNPINASTGVRKNTISYQALGSGGTSGRGIIVGKFEPILQDETGVLLDDVKIEIRSITTDTVEHSAETGVDGKVNVSGDTHSISYNGRDIDEAGILYVKQSITPAATGAINSVDQGAFRIRMRKRDLQFFESTQSFEQDFDGVKIIQTDSLYTAGSLDFTTVTEINTAQEFYNYYKYFGEQNIDIDLFINLIGNTIELGGYNLVVLQTGAVFDFNGSTFTIKSSDMSTVSVSTTGTVTDLGGVIGSISDANGDSNITATVPTGYDNDIDVYLSQSDAETETGQIATGSSFRYNSSTLGGQTVWFRMTQLDGSFIIENYQVPLLAGNYSINLVVTNENAALGAIRVVTDKLDNLFKDVDIADRLKRIDGNTQII